MDPVSLIGICVTAAKLIAKISSGVNRVLDAPRSVQELSTVTLAFVQVHQQNAVDDKIHKIQAAVEFLHQGRRNVKEAYVVLETNHSAFASADPRLLDTRNQNQQIGRSQVKDLQASLRKMGVENQKLKEELEISATLSLQI
ncbi:hypothetical protein EG329_004604 [Mollisiaceae sp. DMI_Dod_QoI]|nr:hypothetical protein EG329_004604 [Helotiales sp. DMI_Dod_QoI]